MYPYGSTNAIEKRQHTHLHHTHLKLTPNMIYFSLPYPARHRRVWDRSDISILYPIAGGNDFWNMDGRSATVIFDIVATTQGKGQLWQR